jgi:NADH-quinone oxidoreductase subunit M
MMQMLSHGLISGALFLCVGVLYDRMHSREISAYGGVINTMPKFAALMVLFGLANAGLPGTSGFVGEFFVILGTFHANPWLAFLAATTGPRAAYAVDDQARRVWRLRTATSRR